MVLKSLCSCCLQLLNRELRQAKSANLESQLVPDAQSSSQPPSLLNHLPLSPPDGPASAQTASPAAPTKPAAPSASPAPAKLHLGETQVTDFTAGIQNQTCVGVTARHVFSRCRTVRWWVCISEEEEEDGNVQPGSQEETQSS